MTSPENQAAMDQVASLAQLPGALTCDPKQVAIAWELADGGLWQGQAQLAAYAVSQSVKGASLRTYRDSPRERPAIMGDAQLQDLYRQALPPPKTSPRSERQRLAQVAAYAQLLGGVHLWQEGFMQAYLRVPDYPAHFFAEGVTPPDLSVRKMDLDALSILEAVPLRTCAPAQRLMRYADELAAQDARPTGPPRSITYVGGIYTGSALELTGPEPHGDLRDALELSALLLRHIVFTRQSAAGDYF